MAEIIGDNNGQTLVGTEGGDFILGLGGLDFLEGRGGDDLYVLLDADFSTYDVVTELAGAGNDTVVVVAARATVAPFTTEFTYSMTSHVENGIIGGVDTGLSGDSAFTLNGNTLGNALTGNRAVNRLNGGAGNDTLNGGLGLDTLDGGSGDDVYVLLDANSNTHDIVLEAAGGGIDTVVVTAATSIQIIPLPLGQSISIPTPIVSYTLAANVENGIIGGIDTGLSGDAYLLLAGNGLDNALTGNRTDNVLAGAGGNDTLNGGLGRDTLDGGAGDDLFLLLDTTAGVFDTVTEAAAGGTDTAVVGIAGSYTLTANVENGIVGGVDTGFASDVGGVTMTGNDLANTLTGNRAANTLRGGGGADTLSGGLGLDTLDGGSGDDIFLLVDANSNIHDVVVEAAGGGSDTVIVTRAVSTQLVASPIKGPPLAINTTIAAYTLTANVENGIIGGVDTGLSGDAGFTLIGNGLDNTLSGNRVANILAGAGGADTLNGGLGLDTLNGGAGDDTFLLDDFTAGSGIGSIGSYDAVIEAAGEGTDSVLLRAVAAAGSGYTLQANVENVTLYGNSLNFNLTGNASDNILAGNGGNNTLTALGGADTLDGQVGVDTLIGGLGDDTYILGDYSGVSVGSPGAYDTVVEEAGGGTDRVVLTVLPNFNEITKVNGYTLTANVEHASLVPSPVYNIAFNLTGNALDNELTGHDGANIIRGLGGNDTLNGGLGLDTLFGGAGDDVYVLDDKTLAPIIGAIPAYDTVTEVAGEGTDTVLVRGLDDLTTVGTDGYTLGVNIENGTLFGNSLNFNLTGNAANNILAGNGGNNTLTGLGGADTLDGQVGVDTLIGGLGDDTYILGDYSVPFVGGQGAYDTVVETANSGIDTVIVTALPNNNQILAINSYTLTANVEHAILVSSPVYNIAFNLTGNGLDNELTGNEQKNVILGLAGNDTLSGGLGLDTLDGGSGDDTYILDDFTLSSTRTVPDAYDTIIEAAGGGTDSVFLRASGAAGAGYTLQANLENVTLFGNALNYNLTGNALANVLGGNGGANSLNGLGGADIMVGGAGNDIYYVDVAGDAVYEDINAAIGGSLDRVLASASYTLAAGSGIELLATTSNSGTTAGINLTGNELVNSIVGNAAGNILNGGGGKDTLTGFGGADAFLFNTALNTASGASFATLASTANVDLIADFNVLLDTIRLENAVFGGLTAGALLAGAFRAGTTALDADDRIIYNAATGALVFDANGNVAGGTQLFAFVTPGLALTHADFLIV